MLKITRDKNPILTLNKDVPWMSVKVFNPGVAFDKGKFRMVFTGGGEKGTYCLGYAESSDGVNFDIRETPFITGNPDEDAFDHGTAEDPRVTYFEGKFYITYATSD